LAVAYPTVTSVMWHPTPELRERWLRQYGRDRFSFEEALYAQTFPSNWLFPESKTVRWKWLGEAFPPKVAEYLFSKFVDGGNLVLLDLFAGIGGWGLGAVWSGEFSKVIMVEVDREKCRYLELNFSKLDVDFEVICNDVREIDVIRADVITASPPCEDLTVLKFFRYNETSVGTIPLTLHTIRYVEEARPRIAFYENVYRKPLAELLRRHGWHVERFDMSKLIPQKRVRLLAYRRFRRAPRL
jgi:site-specific DNA-cytosine methylase